MVGKAVPFGSPSLTVPTGYISGAPLLTTSTYTNASLSSLGVTPGTYTYTWGSGVDADTMTIVVAVPEPSTWALAVTGLLAAVGWSLLRSRTKSIAERR